MRKSRFQYTSAADKLPELFAFFFAAAREILAMSVSFHYNYG